MSEVQNLRVISLDEIAEHNYEDAQKSCWIVISGKVYDVTKFLNEHPGGEEVITQLAGKDATVGFLDIGHSKDAVEMSKEYLIGRLSDDDIPKTSNSNSSSSSSSANNTDFWSDFKSIMTSPTWTNFLIPTTIGIFIYIVYNFLFKP